MNEELKKALDSALDAFKASLPATMSADEVKNAIQAKSDEMTAKFEGMATKEDLANLSSELTTAINKGKTSIKEVKSVNELVSKSMADVKAKKEVSFEIKAVGDMTTANVAVADATPRLSLLDAQGDVYGINRTLIDSVLSYVDLGSTDKASITWVDEVEGEGSVGATTEGQKKNQIDVDFKEKVANATKITGFVKVTEESLDDISYMSGEINRVLNEKLYVKKSADVLADIITNATAFNLTDFNGTVPSADIIDAIIVATAQSTLSGFQPKHIVMHPVDIAKFQLAKSSNIPRVSTVAGVMEVNGLKVIQSLQATKGDFILGDFSKYRVRIYKEKLIIGLDGNDLTENKRTIIGETRLIKYVSSNEKTSFVKGTFATIQAAINKAS